MNDPFSPVYCARCKRPVSDGVRLCENCRPLTPEVASPAQMPLMSIRGNWSPMRVFLLLLLAMQIGWLGWVAVQNIVLHGLGDSLLTLLELFGTGFVPFGLVAADLWQGEDRFTLYGYAAAGYHLFFGLVACIQYREVDDPLHHNLVYILEAVFSGTLLLLLYLYRTLKRAYYET
jgi:hypothetical protein